MKDNRMPLHYAIMMHFLDGREDCAEGVVEALTPEYGGYKLLTRPAVEEALATAKENGILEEAGYSLNDKGELVIRYKVSDFGKVMIKKYIS